MVIKPNSTKETYKEFYGSAIKQMPKLLGEGRVPMNTSQLMQLRLDSKNAPVEVKSYWIDNCFETGDAVVYHPNGEVKIVLDSKILREINNNSKINRGALVLDEDVYRLLEGEVFRKGCEGNVSSLMSRKDVKNNPVWKILSRDKSLLNEYTDLVFSECKNRLGSQNPMGVYTGFCKGSKPEMGGWHIGKVGDGSVAGGGPLLDSYKDRFIGIRSGEKNYFKK